MHPAMPKSCSVEKYCLYLQRKKTEQDENHEKINPYFFDAVRIYPVIIRLGDSGG
jgi:hypothetical protein